MEQVFAEPLNLGPYLAGSELAPPILSVFHSADWPIECGHKNVFDVDY